MPADITISFLVVLLGAVLGSFFNVCIYRIPLGKSIVTPSSSCTACGHPLGFGDMVPVMSFFLLKGACRYCHAKISVRYPLVEALTAILFLCAYQRFGLTAQLPFIYVFVSLLILVAMIDTDHRMIPDRFFYSGLLLSAVYFVFPILFPDLSEQFFSGAHSDVFWSTPDTVFNRAGAALSGGVLGSVSLLLIDGMGRLIFRKESMGMGDAKLMGWVGLFLGLSQTIVALLSAIWIGAIAGVAVLIWRRKNQQHTDHYMPFGPFLATGGMVSLFFGSRVLSWYLSLML